MLSKVAGMEARPAITIASIGALPPSITSNLGLFGMIEFESVKL